MVPTPRCIHSLFGTKAVGYLVRQFRAAGDATADCQASAARSSQFPKMVMNAGAGESRADDSASERLVVARRRRQPMLLLSTPRSQASRISTPTSFACNGAIIWAGFLPSICYAGYQSASNTPDHTPRRCNRHRQGNDRPTRRNAVRQDRGWGYDARARHAISEADRLSLYVSRLKASPFTRSTRENRPEYWDQRFSASPQLKRREFAGAKEATQHEPPLTES
jgi:hypothetical protein